MKIEDITLEERELLSKLKKRPGMYLGSPKLTDFVHWYQGYEAALITLKLHHKHRILPENFGWYVTEKYLGHRETAMGWWMFILQENADEKEALKIFFDLLDEYLVYLGYEKIPEYIS